METHDRGEDPCVNGRDRPLGGTAVERRTETTLGRSRLRGPQVSVGDSPAPKSLHRGPTVSVPERRVGEIGRESEEVRNTVYEVILTFIMKRGHL